MTVLIQPTPANFTQWLRQHCDLFEVSSGWLVCTNEALDDAWRYLISGASAYEGDHAGTVEFWLTEIWDGIMGEGTDDAAILALRDVLLGIQPATWVTRHYVRRLIEGCHMYTIAEARAELAMALKQAVDH